MEVYLDNSATTRCEEEVAELVCKLMTGDFGNPSSMHIKGVEAERHVTESARTLARLLKVKEKEILFTSGGTEGNNLAIIGAAHAYKRAGNRVITTQIEHSSVSEVFNRLEDEGYDVVRLPVDETGVVCISALEEALNDETILVSVMAVNNEIGTVQPLAEIAKLIKERNEKTVFHVDGVQSFGKINIAPAKVGIDLYTASAHKFHGPKGVGFLYRNERVRLEPQILGGGQQGGMRSGTDNVPGISGMALAAELAHKTLGDSARSMCENSLKLARGLSGIADVKINGALGRELKREMPGDGRDRSPSEDTLDDAQKNVYIGAEDIPYAPHIVSATVRGIRAEVLLHALEDKGIYISAGSACSTHRKKGSATLNAIGLEKKDAESTVRFSLSRYTTPEEIEYTISSVAEVVPLLRRFTMK